ncbi:titin-like [Mytilus trossulus]|uniref:titin-like n=1 Tax=Mytilus trossulus TaxID=6551 RepID=UPI0030059D68
MFTWETNRTDMYHVRCDFESGEQVAFFSLYRYRDQYNRNKYKLIKRMRTISWFQIYIFNPKPEDEGLYCCVWLNEEYSELHTETAVLNFTHDPIVQIHGDTAIIEGDTLNITCFSQSFEPSTFLWYNLSQHGYWYSLNETGDSFIIESADRKNSGKYKCLAKNDLVCGSAEISVTIQCN